MVNNDVYSSALEIFIGRTRFLIPIWVLFEGEFAVGGFNLGFGGRFIHS